MADFNSFKQEWLIKGKIDFDHTYGFQCVDLVRQYFYECYGLGDAAGGVATAVRYWTETPVGILAKFDKVEGSNARAGDVLPLKTVNHNDYTDPGHIGIATGNITDANVEILEQNGATGGGTGTGPDAIRTRWVTRSRVAGILRPKNPNATVDQVQALYREILERDADQVGLDHYAGNYLVDFVRNDLANSAEHQTLVAKKEAQTQAEAAAQVAAQSHVHDYTYEKLSAPLDLRTNKDANIWNLDFYDYASDSSNGVLPTATPFRAYGKATRNNLSDKPVYFMTEADFGQADATGTPATAQGIRTVDLEEIPPVAPTPTETPEQPQPEPTPDTGEKIPVTVVPVDPEKWKTSFNNLAAGKYEANNSAIIHDFSEKLPDIQLTKGQSVPVGGSFAKDGQNYFRSKRSVQNDWWYGIPTQYLAIIDLDDDDVASMGLDLDNMKREDKKRRSLEKVSIRQQLLSIIAYIEAHAFRKNTQK